MPHPKAVFDEPTLATDTERPPDVLVGDVEPDLLDAAVDDESIVEVITDVCGRVGPGYPGNGSAAVSPDTASSLDAASGPHLR